MRDEGLRALAREDDPEERAALLAGRVRAGTLPPERVGALAFLGDPAALEVWVALGEAPPPTWQEVYDSLQSVRNPASRRTATLRRLRVRWAEGFPGHDAEVAVRVALAAAECLPSEDLGEGAEGLEVVRAWLELEPGPARESQHADLEARATFLDQEASAGTPQGRHVAACALRAAATVFSASAARYASLALAALDPDPGELAAVFPASTLARVRYRLEEWVVTAGS